MWLSLVAVFLGAGPSAETADAQFKKMEQQVLKSKTLQTEIEVVAASETESLMNMKGKMLVASGNKIRLELEGELRKEKDKMSMVSDGSKMVMSSSKQAGKAQDTNKNLTAASLASYSRGGIIVSLMMARSSGPEGKSKEFDIEKDMGMSDLKLGKKEMVDGSEAQAIEFKLNIEGPKDALAITVWVDLKTNLPVKRVAVGTEGKMTFTITEKYSKTVLGGKIDEKEFTLPK